MPSNLVVRVKAESAGSADLKEALAKVEQELELPTGFPADVTAAAERAAAGAVLPELDRTDIEFLTIDPEGSRDLDQALHIERDPDGGFVVHYAIADVAAFVRPGDPIDVEAHRRGETLYGADHRIPLHPPGLSEGAASLLPDQTCPALLWTMQVDATGEGTSVRVERALVRSRQQLSYVGAQAALDDGSAGEVLQLLREVGTLREAKEQERGGISLPLPEQEVHEEGGRLTLEFREQLPVELWNAQISLMTGMAAATLMLEGRIGVLRTLPPPDPRDVARLRRVAKGLRIDWPGDVDYPELIRSLDRTLPAHQAMAVAATRLLRGSGYAAFDGELPEQTLHSAIAAPYAHVTAPLRRLGDRYTGEVCVALCAGQPVPDWVRAALPDLPKTLQDSARRANAYERAILDVLEAGLLQGRVGEEFTGVVTSVDEKDERRGVVLVEAIGVEAPLVSASGPLPLGTEVAVRLTVADLSARKVEFTVG
ncbi:VacB/RNase II family 3'-5' exoribonuclease [Nocardioides thalensis]|uniref:VacB/RNase II family 3'-5' exoribonuclease n=1 Tax=Nocardioides thalensis TaxID=1914755 RepID=A0A853C324_9ACTN|nr:RNB domain-containing ribonuclease [Nocardioides thalensis]NYJ00988.1 VacB/RNase II family 3'-5' exoribonuclease [Nocardioides thalensis]